MYRTREAFVQNKRREKRSRKIIQAFFIITGVERQLYKGMKRDKRLFVIIRMISSKTPFLTKLMDPSQLKIKLKEFHDMN
jgi:hypothetical protein